MRKKLTGIMLSIALIISMMPSGYVFAEQTAVTYLDANLKEKTCTNYRVFPECKRGVTVELSGNSAYVVNRSISINLSLSMKLLHDTQIIIQKGCSLSLRSVDLNGHKLEIYAENNFDESGKCCNFIVEAWNGNAVKNGEIELNSGRCTMVGSYSMDLTTTYDVLSNDSKLTVNNGIFQSQGGCGMRTDLEAGPFGTHAVIGASIGGKVGTGAGITINNCVKFVAVGGPKAILGEFDTGCVDGKQKCEGTKAFSENDVSKFTLNGNYYISGKDFNTKIQEYGNDVEIKQKDFSSKIHLYDYITIVPGVGENPFDKVEETVLDPELFPTVAADFSDSVSVTSDDKISTASVDISNKVDDLIKNATDTNAREVAINAKASKTVDKANVTIPADAFTKLAKLDNIRDAVISTDVCDFKLDKQALAEIAKQASAGSKLTIEALQDSATTEDYKIYNLHIKSGDKTISNFNGGKIMVTVDIPKDLNGQPATCLFKGAGGLYKMVTVLENSGNDSKISFVTEHFSKYVIMSETKAAKLLTKQTKVKQNAIKMLKNGKIAVSFKKISFGNIVSDKDVKYTVQRSTKKNFKKSIKNYTANGNKSVVKFTDSQKLKKGTKYYYRVRGTVTLSDGSKVNTKWSKVCSILCK